jgi:hypothetical protein
VGAQAGLFNRSEGCWFEVEVGCIAGPVEGLAIAVVGEQFDLDLALAVAVAGGVKMKIFRLDQEVDRVARVWFGELGVGSRPFGIGSRLGMKSPDSNNITRGMSPLLSRSPLIAVPDNPRKLLMHSPQPIATIVPLPISPRMTI